MKNKYSLFCLNVPSSCPCLFAGVRKIYPNLSEVTLMTRGASGLETAFEIKNAEKKSTN